LNREGYTLDDLRGQVMSLAPLCCAAGS